MLSKDGNIIPKKRVNRDKCNFATKQLMFGVFAIDDPRSSDRALYATLFHSKVKNKLQKLKGDMGDNFDCLFTPR